MSKLTSILRRISTRLWLVIAALAVVIAGLATWLFGFVLPDDSAADDTVTQTATASLETLEKTVTASGTVTPAVQDDVSFEVSGTVTAVYVAAGQTVAAGDTLATVDTLSLNATLADAKAQLAEAEATLASANEDDDGTDVSAAKITAAAAQVDVAQASVDEAQAALEDATLVAPAAGLVTSVGVSVGDKISSGSSASSSGGGSSSGTQESGDSTGSSGSGGSGDSSSSGSADFTIVSTDSWALSVTVGETDIANVAVGQQVELTTDDGIELFGTVSTVAALPSTTDGSAAYPVTIAVTGTDDSLYDGVNVDAAIVYERRTDVLTVPSAAVTTTDGESTVTVVADDGTQTVTPVEIGEQSGQLTEITSGISEGDSVLVAEFTPGEGNSDDSGGQQQGPGGGEMPADGQFPGGDDSGGGGPGGSGQGGSGQGGSGQGGSGQGGGQ